MIKLGRWIVVSALVGGLAVSCGAPEGASGCSAGGTSSEVTEALNQQAPEIEIPGANDEDSGTQAIVVVDDDNQAIGSSDEDWVLQIAEEFANLLTEFGKGIFFRNDGGGSSLVSEVISHVSEGTASLGPVTVGSGEDSFAAGMMFQAFAGCASAEGTFHSDLSGNPLSLTAFLGSSESDLARVASICVTSLEPLVGTAWLDAATFFSLFGMDDGGPSGLRRQEIPSTFRLKLTVDLGNHDSSCPYATCERYGVEMFRSGEVDFQDAPLRMAGTLYLNAEDDREFLVTAGGTFGSSQQVGPCVLMDGFVLNFASNGSEVAGLLSPFLQGELPTRDNGGVVTGAEGCADAEAAETTEEVTASFAQGLCANDSGELLSSADCSIDDDPMELLDNADDSETETGTEFPSDAPATFVGS